MSIEQITTSFENWKPQGLPQTSPEEALQSQQSIENSNKLQKINDILGIFDFSNDQEQQYREFLLKQNNEFLETALNKPKTERLQYLIQAQIDELEAKGINNLSRIQRLELIALKKQIIAAENQKQKQQQVTITAEKSETEAEQAETASNKESIELKLKTQDENLSALKGALLENPKIKQNTKIQTLRAMFSKVENTSKNRKWLSNQELENIQKEMTKNLEEIINYLKQPWTIESIAKSLGWTNTQEYLDLKNQLLSVEPDLQQSFDRVEMNLVWNLAKIKLGTDNLQGVNLENNLLSQTQDNITIQYSEKEWRSLTNWAMKIKSDLDPQHENNLKIINKQATETLKPINKKLLEISSIINLLQTAQNNKHNFEEIKEQIKTNNPALYNELWLNHATTYDNIIQALNNTKAKLEETKNQIITEVKNKYEKLINQNKKEAEKRDKNIKNILQFFSSIGLNYINQNKLQTIINNVNKTPENYGLEQKIELEKWNIGFNKDFWDEAISSLEKQSFIWFINKMLWEEIIDKNIANKTTTLSPEAIMKLQVLNNKTIGFFMGNLEKKDYI